MMVAHDVDVVAWDEIGDPYDPKSVLFADDEITICGIRHHLEAVEIADPEKSTKPGDDWKWRAINPEWQEKINRFQDCDDCQMELAEIEGRSYLLMLTPYCH